MVFPAAFSTCGTFLETTAKIAWYDDVLVGSVSPGNAPLPKALFNQAALNHIGDPLYRHVLIGQSINRYWIFQSSVLACFNYLGERRIATVQHIAAPANPSSFVILCKYS